MAVESDALRTTGGIFRFAPSKAPACGAGVPPAVARAFLRSAQDRLCPRVGAGRSHDSGRDARTTTPGRRLLLPFLRASVPILLIAFLLAGLAGPMRAAQEPAPSALQLEYRLILTHPNLHLVGVEISAGKVSGEFIDFVMPAWAPGRYAIYDFAKNVQEF